MKKGNIAEKVAEESSRKYVIIGIAILLMQTAFHLLVRF